MIAKVDCGGVAVYFGEPKAVNQPEPFYPFLLQIDEISEATSEATASTGFTLSLAAKDLIVRRAVTILDDELVELFVGIIGRIAYDAQIAITVEA